MHGGKHKFMEMQLAEKSIFTKSEIFVAGVAGVSGRSAVAVHQVQVRM